MVAPGILTLLAPVLERGGLVLEIGCGSGLLTKYLVDAGHRVLATDASPAMVALAREYALGATVETLVVPDDPLPSADAVVSVGHPLSYLDDEAQLIKAFEAIARALAPGGVLAFDICDIEWGAVRDGQPPGVWSGHDWTLITRFSVPYPTLFRREMTMFVRAGQLWRREEETHDNVLIDTGRIPDVFAAHDVDVEVHRSFGDEDLPTGLFAVVGRRRTTHRASDDSTAVAGQPNA